MDFVAVGDFITKVGFPIACAVVLGWFCYRVLRNTKEEHEQRRLQHLADMEKVQARCKEREEVLYAEIKENREINAKAINTIAHYAEKLDSIQEDIKDIKTDITYIMAKDR
jgi:septal ring factor EnvC (AmiA/AmiB activator)